jgi:hypothetical protein
MDVASTGKPWGDVDLYTHVTSVIKPKIHIFGHVHEGYGVQTLHGITFINGASKYWPENPNGKVARDPIVINYDLQSHHVISTVKEST